MLVIWLFTCPLPSCSLNPPLGFSIAAGAETLNWNGDGQAKRLVGALHGRPGWSFTEKGFNGRLACMVLWTQPRRIVGGLLQLCASNRLGLLSLFNGKYVLGMETTRIENFP
ncbi:hypothetical protein GGR53DRAFT_451131 [Hypoxylon sp. FL1150]|nr:hypothetical protein GGR53DRAFT_451131 [Hypoxylon sp. FL1150]